MDFKRNLISFNTIVFDELTRFLRIWPQTIIAPAVTVTLYFIIFGNIASGISEKHLGVSYLNFLAPGLVMMSIITNSYGNVSFSLWNHRFQHSVEEVLIAPLPPYLILLGYTCGGILRGLIVGTLVSFIAMLFTHFIIHSFTLSFAIAFLTATLFSLAGFATAICADKFDDMLLMPNFILTPLIYLGGVFYSISQLTPIWQLISKLNPMLYIINLFRFALIGISDVNILFAIITIITMIVILSIFNLSRLKRGIRTAI